MNKSNGVDTKANIRSATKEDLFNIQTCATDAYSQYIEVIGRKPAPMSADYLHQIESGFVFVAQYQDTFAGFIVFYTQDEHLHIENVAVRPALTRKGIGRMLIHFAEKKATQMGLSAVELYTNEAMLANLTMYPSLGYTQIGKRQDEGFNRVYFRKEI